MPFTKAPSYILTDADYLAVQNKDAECEALKVQLSQARFDLTAAQAKITDLTSQILQAQQSVSALQATVSSTQSKLDSALSANAALIVERDALKQQVNTLQVQMATLQAKLDSTSPTVVPGLVPFTFPPLQYNAGTWPDVGSTTVVNGVLAVRLYQTVQPAPRVLRRDFGFDSPVSGGFLREPIGKLRRYSMKITIPADYKPIEMNNLWQWHTASAKMSPYLAFFGWTTTVRWRHITPDGVQHDYNTQPYKLGHTYDCVVEAKWSQGVDGVLRVWEDGVKIIDYSGPTFRTDEVDAPYILFGQYLPAVSAAFDNTILFSDYRIVDV